MDLKISSDTKKNFLNLIFDVLIKAAEIRSNPEKAKKYKAMGWGSIIVSLFTVGLAFLCGYGCPYFITLAFTYLGIFTKLILIGNIFVFVFGLCLLAVPIYAAICAFVLSVGQLRVNKSAIGWLSMIFAIICACAAAFIMLYLAVSNLGSITF